MQILDIHDPTIIEIVGLLSLGYLFVYKPLKFTLNWLLNNCSRASKRILKPGPGDYAVVTGATDGIGLEYARQLAEKGYSLVLISRTEEKLRRVAGEIREQYPQCDKVEILSVDFSRTDIYDRIAQKLTTLDGPIHVLVNNVGTAFHIPEYFHNYPEEYSLNVINTNIVSVTKMSDIVLKIMLKQKYDPQRNPARGVVINISSGAGASPIPMFSTYSATKGYMNYLSKILSYEYEKDHIIVQTVTPNQVDTKLAKDLVQSAMIVPANDYVRYALKTVGTEQETNGHPRHKFINGFAMWLGEVVGDRLFMKLKMMSGIKFREGYDLKLAGASGAEQGKPDQPLVGDKNNKS